MTKKYPNGTTRIGMLVDSTLLRTLKAHLTPRFTSLTAWFHTQALTYIENHESHPTLQQKPELLHPWVKEKMAAHDRAMAKRPDHAPAPAPREEVLNFWIKEHERLLNEAGPAPGPGPVAEPGTYL